MVLRIEGTWVIDESEIYQIAAVYLNFANCVQEKNSIVCARAILQAELVFVT